jgi:hypothetical protein
MSRRLRIVSEILGPVAAELEDAGVDWQIDRGTKHYKLVLRHMGIERQIPLPQPGPSCARSPVNSRADVRRVAREMGIDLGRRARAAAE